jgi:hypothetical protein
MVFRKREYITVLLTQPAYVRLLSACHQLLMAWGLKRQHDSDHKCCLIQSMPTDVLPRGSSRSGGAPSQLTACFLAETLATGELQRYVYDTLQPTYCRRYRSIVEVINKELIPLGVRLPQTDRDIVGGYFIWLTLPSPLKGAVLAQRAKDEENVVVAQVSTEHEYAPSLSHRFG